MNQPIRRTVPPPTPSATEVVHFCYLSRKQQRNRRYAKAFFRFNCGWLLCLVAGAALLFYLSGGPWPQLLLSLLAGASGIALVRNPFRTAITDRKLEDACLRNSR